MDHVNDDMTGAPVSVDERIHDIISSLPVVLQHSVSQADTCPICLLSFGSIFSEDTGENGEPYFGGVTKLAFCGHLFCRKDLVEWIQSYHGTCPTCRHIFLEVRPPESDNESSDGGEYIPEDGDDDDTFFDTDGFTDEEVPDYGMEMMDTDSDPYEGLWEPMVEDEHDFECEYEAEKWGPEDDDEYGPTAADLHFDDDGSSEADLRLGEDEDPEVGPSEADLRLDEDEDPELGPSEADLRLGEDEDPELGPSEADLRLGEDEDPEVGPSEADLHFDEEEDGPSEADLHFDEDEAREVDQDDI